MADHDPRLPTRAIRAALARDRYDRNRVEILDPEIGGHAWLVATHRGLFAVSHERAKIILHGWFFGICRDGDTFYIFENCGSREPGDLGRLVSLRSVDGRLGSSKVLATGLHNNCHQIRIIDQRLCLVDTANQAVIRFDRDGIPFDVRRPFPAASPSSDSGDYLHINSVAKIGGRIAIMLHNGKARPEKESEIAWVDDEWRLEARVPVAGRCCHDVVEDELGTIWHCASMSGEIAGSNGRRIRVSDELMTRGLAISRDAVVVGVSTFGPRHQRDGLNGGVVIFDRNFSRTGEIALPAGPADIVKL